MAIAGIDRYGAASGYQPIDRASREQAPLAPDLAETAAANTQTIFQALQPSAAETQRLESLVASARAASVALEARADEAAAADEAEAADAAAEADATATAEAQDAEAADAAATDTDGLSTVPDEPIGAAEAFAVPSAQDVANTFEAVAALVPTEQTLAPPFYEDEDGLSVQGVDAGAAGETDAFARTNTPPPGELLSRFA